MDEQIHRPRCSVKGCNQIGGLIGIGPNGKMWCGLCLLKFENKVKEHKRKYFEIIEKEMEEDAGTHTKRTKETSN